jgi:two-component SAPR family response regulator
VTGESTRLEARLVEAARLRGEERLEATLEALAICDRGEHLSGLRSAWTDERRRQLEELAADTRQEAARLALEADRYAEAQRLTDRVLDSDPFREGAWRLRMRIAGALGDDDGVIGAYRGCRRVLAQLGTTPSPSTRRLLERLRR